MVSSSSLVGELLGSFLQVLRFLTYLHLYPVVFTRTTICQKNSKDILLSQSSTLELHGPLHVLLSSIQFSSTFIQFLLFTLQFIRFPLCPNSRRLRRRLQFGWRCCVLQINMQKPSAHCHQNDTRRLYMYKPILDKLEKILCN